MPSKRKKEGSNKEASAVPSTLVAATEPPDEPPVQPPPPFPVVAVGASAGGLEAFKLFLAALPVDTGMAFVFILHMAPKRESALVEILARGTKMPVLEIYDHLRLQQNHIYVIPPGKFVSLTDGSFKVVEREPQGKPPHPIDHFMRSLAEHTGEHAIGIVLDRSEPVELSPQNAYIRRLQHQMAERANLVSRSRGREPYRRVRLYPDAARSAWR